MRASDNVVTGFIRGYIEGEGHVSTSQREITVASMSTAAGRRSNLARHQGITAQLHPGTTAATGFESPGSLSTTTPNKSGSQLVGKTEAYLGLGIFGAFFDRFRGKNYGVSADPSTAFAFDVSTLRAGTPKPKPLLPRRVSLLRRGWREKIHSDQRQRADGGGTGGYSFDLPESLHSSRVTSRGTAIESIDPSNTMKSGCTTSKSKAPTATFPTGSSRTTLRCYRTSAHRAALSLHLRQRVVERGAHRGRRPRRLRRRPAVDARGRRARARRSGHRRHRRTR